jgi:hypothetical protein
MSIQARYRRLSVILGVSLWLTLVLLGVATLAFAQPAPHSQEGGADLSKLRDITGIERTAAPPASNLWRVAAAFTVAVLAVLALTTWGIRRLQPRPQPSLSFSQRALDELERLGEFGTWGGGTAEAYHMRLSDIVRHYLQARFHIPATQRTNEEFFGLLEVGEMLPPEQREVLGQFLKRCDMAKFAAAQFTASECESTRYLARRFVEATSAGPQSPGVVPVTAGLAPAER